jgi:hypothetical protein
MARRSSEPSSGSSAISVRAITGPTPGTETSRSLLLAPGRRAAHGIVDLAVDIGEHFLECLAQTRDAFLQALVDGAPLALAFGPHHLDDLAAPRDKIGEELRRCIRQGAHLRFVASTK